MRRALDRVVLVAHAAAILLSLVIDAARKA